jgi:hypothetical protein
MNILTNLNQLEVFSNNNIENDASIKNGQKLK